jgi:hypothetical protein
MRPTCWHPSRAFSLVANAGRAVSRSACSRQTFDNDIHVASAGTFLSSLSLRRARANIVGPRNYMAVI